MFFEFLFVYFCNVNFKLSLENPQTDPFHHQPSSANFQNPDEESENVPKRKRKRKRLSSNKDENLRNALRRRDRWANRREFVERRMLTLTGVVFLILFIHVGLHLLIDQYIPLLNEVLFGIAALALAIWGGFRFVEWISNKKYKSLTKHQRSDRASQARDLQRSVQPNLRKQKGEREKGPE